MARPLPNPDLPWPVPLAAVELIANYEGLRLQAYRCPAGILTCGWGETQGVSSKTVWTKEHADERLCESLNVLSEQVRDLCTLMPTANELGAMVSLAYNIGLGGLKKSTVLWAHNAGDRQSASRAFGLWNKAKISGVLQELAGLTARRAAEAALYLQQDEVPARMPQAVAPETRMLLSPIAQSGAAATAVGSVSVLAEVNKHVETDGPLAAKTKAVIVDTLGIPEGALVPVLLVLVGAVIVWQRYKQRIRGWA